VRTLCAAAADGGARIMIDAEHSYFQPAIDMIAKQMQREFNRRAPVVLNTYQCYLKDSRFRLNADIESARRQGYKFGAKLVRGAYMVLEREKAAREGYPSPIHDSIQDTHTNYNRCVRMLIQVRRPGPLSPLAIRSRGMVRAVLQHGCARRGYRGAHPAAAAACRRSRARAPRS
jgi:proline dehydrogenase